ncbi:MAG: phosphomannomutase [bacterium]
MSVASLFKAYDIRGKIPDDLNPQVAFYIGKATAQVLSVKKAVMGHDIRQSSPELSHAICHGLQQQGVEIIDIGLCGTEEIYYATSALGMDAGIMVTASHNPIDYNGIKMVKSESRPVSGDSELPLIKAAVLDDLANASTEQHKAIDDLLAHPLKVDAYKALDHRMAFVEHLLTYVDVAHLAPLQVAVDPGNGGAGLVIDALAPALPFNFYKVNFEPDGTFPAGIPNPLLPEQRQSIIQAVQTSNADFGIAWDGDFDRCFFVDEQGRFIEGYYIVGLLADAFLQKQPNEKIIHDPRLTWNTIDVVQAAGGTPIESKTGHAFIKESMRREQAIYGGEMSAHHYFRDFAYCDSGMIPWLLVAELVSKTGKSLSQLIDARMQAYPCSGEINFRVKDIQTILKKLEAEYSPNALEISRIDGISMVFTEWRFNIRASNTEPLLRLNVESRANIALMQQKTAELSTFIQNNH